MNVIITGANKGIGKAIAFAFASCGYDLFLGGRNQDHLNETAAEIVSKYPTAKVKVKSADLSIKEELHSFADWCLEHGTPGILVNNAGVYLPGNSFDEPEGTLESMMNINLYCAYHLTRKLVPAMIKAGSGHIFNICSIASLQAYDGGGGYSISKFALDGFTRNLRHELKNSGVKVTAVYPGAVITDSWVNFDNSSGRIMLPEDIAAMVLAASRLSPQATVEEIVIRPQQGDL